MVATTSLGVPMLVIATTAVLAAATVVAGLLPPRGPLRLVVATALLAHAMIAISIGFAGLVVRSFSAPVLLGIALGWLIGAVLLALRDPAARVAWPARIAGAGAGLREAVREPATAAAAVLVLGTVAWRTFLVLRMPVVDYDGWSYHLVFSDTWLQMGALTEVPYRPWTAGYPAATELVTTWFAAFPRSDALTGLTSLLPIPLAVAAVAGLARELGADRPRALLAGLLVGMTPALVALAGTTYVDGSSVATVVATWWLGLRVVRGERTPADLLVLGIAGGLAVGTKGTNVLLVAPILAVAGLLLIAEAFRGSRAARSVSGSLRQTHLRAATWQVVAFGLPLLVLGGSWYVKNIVSYGNPLYPFALGPFDGPTTLADFAFVPPQLEGKGLVAQLASSWTRDWDLNWYTYNVRPGGFGRAWPLIAAASVAGVVVLASRRRILPLVLVALPAAVTLLTMPMPWYARLTLFVPALGAAFGALALGRLRPRLATAGGLAVVALAAVSLVSVNVRPNHDIRDAFDGQQRWPRPGQYLGYLLDPDDTRRMTVSLRSACAGFDVIPAGSVVVPGGFNLLHGVVGPHLERRLSEPLGPVGDARSLAAEIRSRESSWLVTGADNDIRRLAEAAPDLFIDRGETCRGAHLWQLRSAS